MGEKTEEEWTEEQLKDLPDEIRRKLKKKRKGQSVEEWVEEQRREIAEKEKIKPFS
ncbi:MAG: hypothetical protein ACE5DI_02350 [Candidatus Micrarchaeia archaeon]